MCMSALHLCAVGEAREEPWQNFLIWLAGMGTGGQYLAFEVEFQWSSVLITTSCKKFFNIPLS